MLQHILTPMAYENIYGPLHMLLSILLLFVFCKHLITPYACTQSELSCQFVLSVSFACHVHAEKKSAHLEHLHKIFNMGNKISL